MKEISFCISAALAIILVLISAGCVAPPTEKSLGSIGSSGSGTEATGTTAPQAYVTEETVSDFARCTTAPLGYSTFAATTRIPEDITCRIYTKTAWYGYNGSAFSFDLLNPPMYIQYVVKPTNVSVTKVFTSRTGNREEKTITYSDYSPNSWFEITVSNKTSGTVYLKDGFGEAKGYSTYLNRTLKIINRDTMYVELRGNDIKATATIWVKPVGNFNESLIPTFTDCAYLDTKRDTIATAKPTTIAGITTSRTGVHQ
jgi:hypothetical protein